MNGTEYAKQIIQRYKKGESLSSLISELESETLKGPLKSAISLASDNDNEPNVRPWNWLGLELVEEGNYEQACDLWQRMIIMANLTAESFYKGIAYLGTPYNNLGYTLIKMKRLLDGFHYFLKAFEFDIATAGSSSVALRNLLGLIPEIQKVQSTVGIPIKKGLKDRVIEYSLYTIAVAILSERILTMVITCRGIEINDLIYLGFSIAVALISYSLPRIAKLTLSTSGISIEFRPEPIK